MNIEGITKITVTVTTPDPGQLDQYTYERNDADECFDAYLTPTQLWGFEGAGPKPHFPCHTFYTFEQLSEITLGQFDDVLGRTWEVS